MGMRVWFGGEFEYDHERAALEDLMREAVPRWSQEQSPYALFVDFWVDSARIDLMAITERAIVIIDLKNVTAPNGYLTGALNGPWFFHAPDGASWRMKQEQNPFKQVEGYRRTMMKWLKDYATAVFGYQKGPHIDPQVIDAWVVPTPSIDEARTEKELNFIPERDRHWFKVVGLDKLCDALFARLHQDFRITESEIEKLARLHGLVERTTFAGFLWPGTLTEPKPPLFHTPPRYWGTVGRSAELDETVKALDGKASVLSLVGPTGVGKTHLASALAAYLGKNRPVKWIDCGQASTCEVSLQTLLLALAHEMPATVDRQVVADREQPTTERITRALDWCDKNKLAFVFDDYDDLRPDHDLAQFIRQLNECCHVTQAIIVSSRRPDFLSDPAYQLQGAHTVIVGGLNPDDSIEYLRKCSSQGKLHLDLKNTDRQLIWDRTGGMPASLYSLAQVSANRAPDRVLLAAGGTAWEETARKLFEELIRSVSPAAQQLAAAASLVRRGLDADFLLALAEPDRGQTLLNELVNACVLTAIDDRGFVLAGGLRQYLSDQLDATPEMRTQAHSRAARHLLMLRAQNGQEEAAPDVAQLEEGLWHAAKAGEAELFLQHAPLVVRSLSHRGEYGRALDEALAGETAAASLGRPRDVAYWRIEQAAILRHLGKADESERLCQLGLEVGESLDDGALMARADHVLGSLALAKGDHVAARRYCEAALNLDRLLDNRPHEAASLARLAGLEAEQGRRAEAAQLYRQSLALAEGRELPGELARRHFDFSLVQKYDGKLEDALAHLEQARVYAERAGRPSQMAVVLGQLAEVRSRLGRHAEALQALDQAVALRNALPDPRKALITLGIGVDILIEMGDVRRAVTALSQLETEAQNVDDPVTQAFLKKRRGLIMLLQHHEAEGLALVDEACIVFRAQGGDHWVTDCQATVERILARADAEAAARAASEPA